jgi:N-glycosidase YbiA
MTNVLPISLTLIDYFDAPPFEWLSNFYGLMVRYEGRDWMTTEHAFQAMKTLDQNYQERIRRAPTPGEAKFLGQRAQFERFGVPLREDWETIKYDVMLDLLRIKFSDPGLRAKLLATGNAKLVEGNTWNDTCWGVCNGVGANNLGRSLMLVRAEKRCELLEWANRRLRLGKPEVKQ